MTSSRSIDDSLAAMRAEVAVMSNPGKTDTERSLLEAQEALSSTMNQWDVHNEQQAAVDRINESLGVLEQISVASQPKAAVGDADMLAALNAQISDLSHLSDAAQEKKARDAAAAQAADPKDLLNDLDAQMQDLQKSLQG